MESELSLRILPELSDLTKAIDRITKSISKGLSKAIESPLNKLKDKLKMELDIGTKIAGPKLPQSSLKEMGKQIRKATSVKLYLDLKQANAKNLRFLLANFYLFTFSLLFALFFAPFYAFFFFFAL